jgi:pimeloyl-ACP methyl ester carboxylesterase
MELEHHRAGAGEPLVLIHGIGSRWQVWAPVIAPLARRHEVVAVDLPGFGASPPLPGGAPAHVAGLADLVLAFLERHGIERPHVAGNSLGGGIALELARRGGVRSATAVSPIGFWTPRELAFAEASLRASRLGARHGRGACAVLAGSAPGRMALGGQMFGRAWRMPAHELVASIDALAAATAFEAVLSAFAGHRAPGDLGDVPVTIAWGDRDRLLLHRQAARARRLLPRARHVTLPGCGHVPFYDDPAMVASVLLAAARG